MPAEDIDVLLTSVLLANLHTLPTLLRPDAHHDGTAVEMLLSLSLARAHPPNCLRIIPYIDRAAMAEPLASADELVEARHRRHRGLLVVLGMAAVEVAQEDARVAGLAKQDHGVGERLEGRRDGAGKRLGARLRQDDDDERNSWTLTWPA
jgi:hypothetical protein